MQRTIIVLAMGVVSIIVGMVVIPVVDEETARQTDTRYSCTISATHATAPSGVAVGETFQSTRACSATSGWTADDISDPSGATAAQFVSGLNIGAGSSGGATATGSQRVIYDFSGAAPIASLTPLILRVVLLILGIGLIGVSGAGMAGYGPMRA